MNSELLTETQHSYYEYVAKIASGSQLIANNLRTGKEEDALVMISNLAEGLQWLVSVEKHMAEQQYRINSRIEEVPNILNEINEAIEANDMVTVADLFEYEIKPLFSSATEWVFKKLEA